MSPSDQPIQVTVHDPVTGETVTRELMNDYLILAAGTCTYQIDANLTTGKHVITVTGRRGKAREPLRLSAITCTTCWFGECENCAGRDCAHRHDQRPEPLIDPDCRDGKCGSCVGGPCEHHCHKEPTHA